MEKNREWFKRVGLLLVITLAFILPSAGRPISMPAELLGCYANGRGLRVHVELNRIVLDSGDSEEVTVFRRKGGGIGATLKHRALAVVTGASGGEQLMFDGKPQFIMRFVPKYGSLETTYLGGRSLVMFKSVCAAMAAPTG